MYNTDKLYELNELLDEAIEFTTFKYKPIGNQSGNQPEISAPAVADIEHDKKAAESKPKTSRAKKATTPAKKKFNLKKAGKYGAVGAGALGLGYGAHHLYRQHMAKKK